MNINTNRSEWGWRSSRCSSVLTANIVWYLLLFLLLFVCLVVLIILFWLALKTCVQDICILVTWSESHCVLSLSGTGGPVTSALELYLSKLMTWFSSWAVTHLHPQGSSRSSTLRTAAPLSSTSTRWELTTQTSSCWIGPRPRPGPALTIRGGPGQYE